MFIFYLIPLVLFLLFIAAYKINPVNLFAGFLLSCSLVSFFCVFFLHAYSSQNIILRFFLAFLVLFVVFLLSFGAYIFIAFLILNTRSILKKEKRDLKHCLTLILAAGLVLIIIASRFIPVSAFPRVIQYIFYSAYGVIIFYLLHLTQFIISMFLCSLSRPAFNQDYIITLGCWINNGEVTPILTRRLDKAIWFYNRQKEITGKPPKLLFSGGKGPDETRSEAEAMKIYALKQGIPDEDIIIETASVSTFENMKFSKVIMDNEKNGASYNCIYATNNYHVLRSGIYARKAGLKACGIGAKTAFYYLPNAVLREYIAYMYIHLKLNIVFGVLSLALGAVGVSAFFAYLERIGAVF